MVFLKVKFTWVTLLTTHVILCTATNDVVELVLSPINFFACTEKTVEFTCQLRGTLEQPVLNDSIGFEICENQAACIPVPENELIVINETMTKFEYGISTKPRQYIRCNYRRGASSEPRTKFSTVHVYEMLEKIKDLNCILENYIGSMRCTWSYNKDYQSPSGTVVMWKDIRWQSWDVCKNLSANFDSCYWKSTRDNGDYTMKRILIQITMVDKCMKNVTSEFEIDTSGIVKPAPVSYLKSMVLNSTCIRLNWKTSWARPEYAKRHFINISSKWNSTTTNFATEQNGRKVSKTFCNLHPYTLYTFSVCMKPIKGGYCSDNRSVRARTFSARPNASPVVTPGAYAWNSNDCEGSKTERNICLFWKPVNEEDMNGGTGNVSVVFVHEKENVTVEWPGNTTSGCVLLSCRKEYTAYIKAKNENGTSDDASVLQIESSSHDTEKPEFMVEMADTLNGNATLHIRLVEASGVNKSGLTVFWCRKSQGNCNKKSPVQWKTSDDESHDVVRLHRPDDYLFGVSRHGSGIEWDSCIYTKAKKPTMRVENINVDPGRDHSSLVVTWNKPTCKPGEPFISHYSVTYCIVNNSPSCKEEIVPTSSKPRLVLKELMKKKYAVTVRAVSIDQLRGPKSETKIATPSDNSLPLKIILGAGAGLIVVLIACFVGIRFRRKIRQFKKESSKISIPPDLEESKGLQTSSSSVDSGYPQQNSPGLEETMETNPLASPKDKSTLSLHSNIHFDFVTGHRRCLLKQGNNMSNFKYENTGLFLQKVPNKPYRPAEEKAFNANDVNKITDEIAKILPVPIEFKDEDKSTIRLLRDTTNFQNDFSIAKDVLQKIDRSNSGEPFLFPEKKDSESLSEKMSHDSSENTILQEKTALCGPINSNSTKAEDPETKGNLPVYMQYTLASPLLVNMACNLGPEKESRSWNDSETFPMNSSTELNHSSSAEMNFSQLPVPVAFLSSSTIKN